MQGLALNWLNTCIDSVAELQGDIKVRFPRPSPRETRGGSEPLLLCVPEILKGTAVSGLFVG